MALDIAELLQCMIACWNALSPGHRNLNPSTFQPCLPPVHLTWPIFEDDATMLASVGFIHQPIFRSRPHTSSSSGTSSFELVFSTPSHFLYTRLNTNVFRFTTLYNTFNVTALSKLLSCIIYFYQVLHAHLYYLSRRYGQMLMWIPMLLALFALWLGAGLASTESEVGGTY